MLKSASQNESDNQYSSERKDKRGKRKCKKHSVNMPHNVEVTYKGNAESRPERQNSSQTRGSSPPFESSLILGERKSVWDPTKSAATSLFPNVESVVNEEPTEEEMVARAIAESLHTAFLENCVIDEVAKSEKSAEESPEDDTWTKVQRNLPAPERNGERKRSDTNNNKGLARANSAAPAEKLARRRWATPRAQEPKVDQGHSSETAPRNEESAHGVAPSVAPKFVDRYGRIDGCSEKHLFMGKGGRFKEEEYLKQQQQQELLESANEIDAPSSSQEDSARSARQPAPSSKGSRASSQDSEHRSREATEVSDSHASSQHENLPRTSRDSVGPAQTPRDPAEGQAATEKRQVRVPSESVLPSEALDQLPKQSAHSSHEPRDYARQASGSQTQQIEQTSSLAGQDRNHPGRPIVAAGSSSSHQQRKSPASGQSWNRGGHQDPKPGERNPKRESFNGSDRGSRPEQFSGQAHAQANNRGGQRADRNFQKSHGEPGRDSHKNPHAFNAENKRGGPKSQRARRNSYKHEGEQSRELEKNGEPTRRESHQERRIAGQNDDLLRLSAQESGAATSEQLATNEPTVSSGEDKEFHEPDAKIVSKNVPRISDFNSRYTTQFQGQDALMHSMNVAPPTIPPANAPRAAHQPPHYSETSSAHYAGPPGFQHLDRPAPALCENCAPFEIKHANLRVTDPNLYRLLLLKVQQCRIAAASCNGTSANPSACPTTWSCRCSGKAPKNPPEPPVPSVPAAVLPEESYHAQPRVPQQAEPPMINTFYPCNVALPYQEALNAPLLDAPEWNPANMQPPMIPFHESPQFVACAMEPANQPCYFVEHPYANVQRAIDPRQQPLADDALPFAQLSFENIPLEVQQQWLHRMMGLRYEIAPGYHPMPCEPHGEFAQAPMAKCFQHALPPPMPFPPKQYGELMGRVNFVHANPPNSFHLRYAQDVSHDLDSAMRTARPGDSRGPGAGRGRARLPQNN